MDQKTDSIAHLCDRGVRAKIPNRRREHILASSKERSKIVGLVSPVSQVAMAGAATHALLIHMKDELVVGAYIHVEVLRLRGQFDALSKVEHDFISLWNTGSGDPLRLPKSALVIIRNLRPQMTDAGK
jgi:hypothetical protein